jgi:CheY-like chemotaxis protein
MQESMRQPRTASQQPAELSKPRPLDESQPASRAQERKSKDELGPNRFAVRRILIVEDNYDGRETLRTLLQLLRHRVEVAVDGLEGVEKGLGGKPEIAIVDIGLPRLDGYQVAQQLRAAFGSDIYLIAHTGYGLPEDRRRALHAGFNAHLVKPADLQELCQLIGRVRTGPAA